MRVIYLTIDNVNDNVILSQTLPFLGELAACPGVDGLRLFALRKGGGERYREYLPPGPIEVTVGENRGIWHPLTWLCLLRFALAAWRAARGGALLIGRNPLSLLCLTPAGWRRGSRLVLDQRGLLAEEYALQGKIAARGLLHGWLRRLERWALGRAETVLAVSERLATRGRRLVPASGARTRVIPCCADPRVPPRDPAAVAAARREAGLDPRRDFVLVYTGSLSAWNLPEAILDTYRLFRAAHPATRLLLLTEDTRRAEARFGVEPGVTIRAVPHGAIGAYLAAGDLGLLVRRPGPVNRVASPVKFAEYLACGVPVLVSPGVGDCPGVVKRAGVGFVLDGTTPPEEIVSAVRRDREAFRARCRETARRRFDRTAYAEAYRRLLAPAEPPRGGGGRRILGLILLALGGLAAAGIVAGLYAPSPPLLFTVEEPLNHGIVSEASRVQAGGFHPTARGYALAPGATGELLLEIRPPRPLGRFAAVTLQWFGGGPELEGDQVELLAPQGPHRLAEGRALLGERLVLPEGMAGEPAVTLRFRARNRGDEELLLLDKCTLQAWAGATTGLPGAGRLGGAGLLLVAGVALLVRRPGRSLAVGLLILVALLPRYANLVRVDLAPLDPDAQAYRAYARQVSVLGPTGIYSAGFDLREPGYPLAVKAALTLFGDRDRSLRLLSLLLSTGLVVAAAAAAGRLLGPVAFVATGLLLALHVPAVVESGRGLRVELEGLLLLGTAWLLFGSGRLGGRRAVAAGCLGGLLALTRFPYGLTLLPLFALAGLRHRRQGVWRPLLAGALILVALAAPQRLALLARHGDPAYDAHRTLHWIRNQEFQGRPGFPSAAEVSRDPFAGPPVTAAEYYLALHTPAELFGRSLRGLARALPNLGPLGYDEAAGLLGLPRRGVDWPAAGLFLGGTALLTMGRRHAWLPLCVLLGLSHVAFAYDLDLPDYRFRMILQVLPFFAISAAAAVAAAAERLSGALTARFPQRGCA
jgi:hypothetical protein